MTASVPEQVARAFAFTDVNLPLEERYRRAGAQLLNGVPPGEKLRQRAEVTRGLVSVAIGEMSWHVLQQMYANPRRLRELLVRNASDQETREFSAQSQNEWTRTWAELGAELKERFPNETVAKNIGLTYDDSRLVPLANTATDFQWAAIDDVVRCATPGSLVATKIDVVRKLINDCRQPAIDYLSLASKRREPDRKEAHFQGKLIHFLGRSTWEEVARNNAVASFGQVASPLLALHARCVEQGLTVRQTYDMVHARRGQIAQLADKRGWQLHPAQLADLTDWASLLAAGERFAVDPDPPAMASRLVGFCPARMAEITNGAEPAYAMIDLANSLALECVYPFKPEDGVIIDRATGEPAPPLP